MSEFLSSRSTTQGVRAWLFCLTIGLGLMSPSFVQAENDDDPTAKTEPETKEPKQKKADKQNKEIQLPAHTLTKKAKKYYNAGHYQNAARTFRALARLYPENPAVYRAMARAYSWASEPKRSIIAYWHYLTLAPMASDKEKISAELELLLRRVKKQPPRKPTKRIQQAFNAVEVRAKAGRFTGKEGALGALNSIFEADYVGPKIGQARRDIRTHLVSHSNQAIERWWLVASQVTSKTLAELTSAWEILNEGKGLNDAERRIMKTLDGLTHLTLNEPKRAAQILAPIAPGHPRLRYAQAVALMRSKQYSVAKPLLESLAQGAADRRVHVLLGFARRLTKDDTANEAFKNALDNEDEP